LRVGEGGGGADQSHVPPSPPSTTTTTVQQARLSRRTGVGGGGAGGAAGAGGADWLPADASGRDASSILPHWMRGSGSAPAPAPAPAPAAVPGSVDAAKPDEVEKRPLHEPYTAAVEAAVVALRAAGVLPPESAVNDRSRFLAFRAVRDTGPSDPLTDPSLLDAAGRALPLGLSETDMAPEAEIALDKATKAVAEVEERFRPRKPRFFNRVKTGYDWNRYNKSHYDYDNPPPKTVQGYKFTIFYPDLIDRTKTPRYRLERADTDDYAIIRFIAGPPYEDVAFKIVNREWEMQPKHGFRCVFDRGVLHLWFNFKRYHYRK